MRRNRPRRNTLSRIPSGLRRRGHEASEISRSREMGLAEVRKFEACKNTRVAPHSLLLQKREGNAGVLRCAELYARVPRSKRSRFMTLFHAATKSCTNFFCESAQA